MSIIDPVGPWAEPVDFNKDRIYRVIVAIRGKIARDPAPRGRGVG